MSPKLLIVIGSLDYGGAERHLVQILPCLAKLGWQIEVFTLSEPGGQAPILERLGITVRTSWIQARPNGGVFYRALRLVSAAGALSLHLARHRPDIVHFFLPQAYVIGGICALLLGHERLVMSRRGRNLYQRKRRLLARLERRLHKRMKAVIGNSRAVVADLREEGVNPDRLGLIYNGLDPAQLDLNVDRRRVRQDLGLPGDALVLVVVANLISYKGHADLIDALAQARLPGRWRVLCVGRDDGILDELKARTRDAGLTENLIWAGPHPGVGNFLVAADVGVLCSHEEGFSNAILEYMFAGLPVVATDVGGNAEAVVNGVTGLIVPAHDPSALAQAIEVLAEPERRAAMGAAGHVRLRSCYSLMRCVAAYDSLYRSIMSGAALPRDVAAPIVDTKQPSPGEPARLYNDTGAEVE